MAKSEFDKGYPKEGMFCRDHKTKVRKSGYCNECTKVRAMKDLYKEGEDSTPVPSAPKLTSAPKVELTNDQLVTKLTSGYRNANLCPNCNPVPKELKNNETVPNVEEITLMGWELKKMEDYYLSKFKEKFERPDLTGLARRSALKKAIMRNLNHLSNK